MGEVVGSGGGSLGPHPGGKLRVLAGGFQAHTQGEVEGSGWGLSPGPHPGGRLRGLAGGVSRPTPGGEVEGSGWGGGYPGPHPGGKLIGLAGGSPGPHQGGLCVYPSMH